MVLRAKNNRVFIVGNDHAVQSMFHGEGFDIFNSPELADIIVFTGGGDIDPALYGQRQIDRCHSNEITRKRDEAEKTLYSRLSNQQVKIGICRGGQLLNVLNGGSMIQDVDNHNQGPGGHTLLLKGRKDYDIVNSYHHQGMVPNFKAKDLEILGISAVSSMRTIDKGTWRGLAKYETDPDFEILWYEATSSFCFQPHPEWGPDGDSNHTRNVFFRALSLVSVL